MQEIIPQRLRTALRASRALAPAVATYDAVRSLVNNRSVPGHFLTTINANYTQVDRYIFAHWWPSQNFGDAVSPLLVRALSKKQVLLTSVFPKRRKHDCFSVVGSVLSFHAPSLTVWGSGFIRDHAKFFERPRKVCAVRGPLSRDLINKQGLECPPIYGDPAVLLFDIFACIPKSSTYKVGLVPHYHDVQHEVVRALARDERVLLIDVTWPVTRIAEALAACDVVVSSSLHGLILADAMGIPNRWLGVSDFVLKGGFKFQDYFLSVRRIEAAPLAIGDLSVDRAVKEAHLRMSPFSRDALLESCPFRSADIASVTDVKFEILNSLDHGPHGALNSGEIC